MRATIANMRKLKGRSGVVAYSPLTGETYSADPADYWYMEPDEELRDEQGCEMVLGTMSETFKPVRGRGHGAA